MPGRRVGWRDAGGDLAPCARCGADTDTVELDRLLWCEACREDARRRAGRWGWVGGGVVALLLGLWLFVAVRPSMDLIPGGWLATLVAALWIASRVVREVVYGVLRYREGDSPRLGPD